MLSSVLRISTLLLTGVAIGVALAAVVLGPLPVWLGLSVCAAVAIAGICGSR